MILTTRVYLAARFERQAEILAIAKLLRASGLTVTSRWLTVDGLALGHGVEAECAARDVEDILAADTLVVFTDAAPGRGGKDFETGIAYQRGLAVIVCGPRVHVFHHLPRVRWVPTVAELLYELGAAEKVCEIGDPW